MQIQLMRVLIIAAFLLLAGCTSPAEVQEAIEPESTPEPMSADLPDNFTAGMAPDWGSPEDKTLRPGVNMVHNGASCTTSFLAHDNYTTYYMMTAAHCVSSEPSCGGSEELPAEEASLRLTDGGSVSVPVAYHSWTTMAKVGESNGDACSGNDFALLQLTAEALALAHPASLHFNAPTGLGEEPTADIWGYGASILKQGVEQTHPKQGTHLGMTEGGWSHHVYLATPGIPGDSGGHIMDEDGNALGIASRVAILPVTGSNYYTDIKMSLEYMLEYEGWAPELITWDDFNASLV